jgi:ketosteroid isomerase-like protein
VGPSVSAANEQVVRDFNDAISRHDFDRLAALLDDGATYEVCGIELQGAGVFDKATMLQVLPGMLGLFEHGSPRMTITRMFRDGDWVIMEGVGEGTFRNGAAYDNRYIIVFEVVDGRVRTVREYMDTQHAATLFAAATAAAT